MSVSDDDKQERGIVHIIDDEADIVRVASTALLSSGYIVHSFSDPSKAMEDMEECNKKMSVVITDIRMPGYNGFEIARKAREVNPSVPIVFMTAFEIIPSEFQKLFPSLQGVDMLKKPFHMTDLLAIVRKHQR
ncbi:MAG TPA: response regulator [Nitrososphaera sp.]|nr:response regulator [Nitrososphaera sp.]